jgi:tetratricopeptide (TPR) repeat protein
MTLAAGTRLGPYGVFGLIGAGGMGEVYKAHDPRLGRTVAIKVLPDDLAADPERRQRFEREARTIAALDHPHICTLYDIGQQGGVTYLVLEYLVGDSLTDRLARGPLPLVEALAVGEQIADALDAAHRHDVVHRDLKPDNVLFDESGHAKVIDFGLAKLRERAGSGDTTTLSDSTAPGVVMGTVAYMSPEQARGLPVDARTDIWSLGVLLYEMLAGTRPFAGASSSDVISAILRDSPPPLALSAAHVAPPADQELPRVVSRCLDKDPGQRYSRAGDVMVELQAIRRGLGAPARHAPHRRLRSRAGVAAGVLVAALTVAGVVGWGVVSRRPALAFRERDFVLVADVVNATGEPVFDLALKGAIETDLRQSRYVNVYDAAQAQNLLRMMRLPPDTRIDERVGRDLCRRAGVRALVVPRILKAGEAYQLGAVLIEPSTGRVVEAVEASVQGREQVLLSALDSVTRDLRGKLGESLDSIVGTDPPFTQYTTSSLEALELLALGARSWARGEFAKAERSFREALQQDRRFAAARTSLGLLLIQFLGRPEEGKAELAQALLDAGEVSQREHLHIRALNKQFVAGDLVGALEDYRFITALYPDMMQPYNNSARILEALGRLREASAMYDLAHERDPQAGVPLWNAYFLRVRRLRDPAGAERAARALTALQPDLAHAAHALAWAFVMQRRFGEAEEQMRVTLRLDPGHPYALPNLAHLLLRRGAVAEALALYRGLADVSPDARKSMSPEHDALCLGLALQAGGEEAEARSVMSAAADAMRAPAPRAPLDAVQQATLAALLAGAGRTGAARALLARSERSARVEGDAAAWLARAHATLGETNRAAALFVRAVDTGYGDPYYVLIDPSLAPIRDRPEIDRLVPPAGVSGDARAALGR